MKLFFQKMFRSTMAFLLVLTSLTFVQPVQASKMTYELYPNPHLIEYYDTDTTLTNQVNVVYESGIDGDTKARLVETLKQKNIDVSLGQNIDESKTNILVGIKGSEEFVDTYVKKNLTLKNADLFTKTDANLLHVEGNVITVLGKDTDSAFYALTTLYHVVSQMPDMVMRNFHMEDYADIVSRGFIEGYYGNPWSTTDRVNLMKWGGYYKLNTYFYAPKDDPKHNAKWRELYTTEEIETKIKPLAKAGNESKCRFVYALHPYMHNAIATDTNSAKYQEDLKVMQAKFDQVIQAGVRQIAILADDAGNKGGPHYIKMLTDMVAWLKEKKETYPDLKVTLPFCVQEYMYFGESYFANFPQEVQIIMTGGRVWGTVNANFTNTFTNNTGRGPYLWINWPCSDNSKNHLIMGGYSDFLKTGVDANKVQGIVLNPMQQSEPSKVAIFGNACYAWNMWESNEEANKAWEDSFDYVDHNSAKDTNAGAALRELSKHMINQNMPASTVDPLQESVELKEKLNPLKTKMNKGDLTKDDLEAIDEVIAEFTKLQNAAITYRKEASNKDVLNQIVYWINCWDDTTNAAIKYLNAIKASINGDSDTLLNELFDAQKAFEKSKTYNFLYVDHQEYAEVGVQHIVPFIKAMDVYASSKLEAAVDPNYNGQTYITNREDDISVGSVKDVFDGNEQTGIQYKSVAHNMIKKGQYVGVTYKEAIDIKSIRIVQGSGKNHYEHSKLQYTLDGNEWLDLPLAGMQNNFTAVQGKPLVIEVSEMQLPAAFKAKGIRLIATENNTLDSWLQVQEIAINKEMNNDISYSLIKKDNVSIYEGTADLLSDSDDRTFVWFKNEAKAGDFVGQDLGRVVSLESVRVVVGVGDADKYTKYTIETSEDGNTYTAVPGFENGHTGSVSGQDVHEISLKGRKARYIRVRNLENKANWVKIAEITATKSDLTYNVIKTDSWMPQTSQESALYDGNDNTWVWYDPGEKDTFFVNDYLGYDLGKVMPLKSAHIVVGQTDPNKADKTNNKIVKYAIETSVNGKDWQAVKGYDNYTGNENKADVLDINLNNVFARYIRIRNLEDRHEWGFFSEFTVEKVEGDLEHVIKNIDSSLTATPTPSGMKLSEGTVTLNKDQYVGLTFDHLYKMTVGNTTVQDGLVIETSKNGLEWTPYEKTVIAGYVRVRSEKDGMTFNTGDLEVNFELIGDYEVTYNGENKDKARDMRTAKNVANVFDNNLATTGSIADMQRANQPIIFDLGQSRTINDIRYYVKETSMDFLRHARFEISETGTSDWQTVLEFGEQPNNTANEDVAKNYKHFVHDSKNPGNMYVENTGLRARGRYLKVTNLSDYSHRWMDFAEIQINGGQYVSTNDTYDIASSTIEVPGHGPLNALDHNFTTTYKPTLAEDGSVSITYSIKNADAKYKQIRIISKGELSNARVTVRHAGQKDAIYVGDLNQYICDLPFFGTAVEVTLTAKNIAPEIMEFILLTQPSSTTEKPVDKYFLANAIDASQYYKETNYTKASWKTYQDALTKAREVLADSKASQELVDQTTANLEKAMQNLVLNDGISYDKAALEALIKEAEGKNKEDYTQNSWHVLETMLNNAKEVLTNEKATNGQVEAATNLLKQAIHDLVKKEVVDKTSLKQLFDNCAKLNEADYTKESWALFKEAMDKASHVLNDEEATQAMVNEAKALLEGAMAQLEKVSGDSVVDKGALEALIQKAEAVNKDLYTKESYQALMDALNVAKAIFNNEKASQSQVQMATESLQTALDGLVEVQTGDVVTGDNTNIVLISTVMLLAGASIAYIIYKKKKDQ